MMVFILITCLLEHVSVFLGEIGSQSCLSNRLLARVVMVNSHTKISYSQRKKSTFSWSASFVTSFRRKSALYDADIKMLNTALTRFTAPSLTTDTPTSSCDLFTRRVIMLEILSVAICWYEKHQSKIRKLQNNFRHSLFQQAGYDFL